MDGDDYQSHNVDTIRTVPCDASFSLSGTLLVALRPLFGWNMDLSDRIFFRHRRRCDDSLEIRSERSTASETHRDGAGREKEEKKSVFQPTYLADV